MGPKKAAAKPKKKEGNPEEGKELDDKEFKELYLRTAVSLQLQLAERTEEASKAVASKRELQSRVSQISKDFEDEQKQTFELTQNMTNQYKGMQEELLSRINRLEETVQQLHDQLSDSDSRQERILKDKNAIIAMKDEEIANLKQKMDDMADEFSEMLKVRHKCLVFVGDVFNVLY
jgi:molybdopterin converting factor small subunit